MPLFLSSMLTFLTLFAATILTSQGITTLNQLHTIDNPDTSLPHIAPNDPGILPPDYYKGVAPLDPTTGHGPVQVFISVIILNMKLSSTADQTLDLDIFLYSNWLEPRLREPANSNAISTRFNDTQYRLSYEWHDRLWTPDIYFRNAVSGSISNILTPTYYFTVTNNERIFMAVRLQLKLSCPSAFAKFPFDRQRCYINMTSTGEDNSTVQLHWTDFRIGSYVDRTEFEVIDLQRSYNCSHDYLELGQLSCLWGSIDFKRHTGNYFIKRFIPSFIVVLVSFLGFWIPTTISPARISLAVTSLLSLITMQIQSDLSVSYVYSLQIWNIVSILFVFGSLLEFSLAAFIMHMETKQKAKIFKRLQSNLSDNSSTASLSTSQIANLMRRESPERCQIDIESTGEGNASSSSKRARYIRKIQIKLVKHFQSTSRHSWMDYAARYLFPVAYCFFVLSFALHSYSDSDSAYLFM